MPVSEPSYVERWVCPDCGDRHDRFDAECSEECCSELVVLPDAVWLLWRYEQLVAVFPTEFAAKRAANVCADPTHIERRTVNAS